MTSNENAGASGAPSGVSASETRKSETGARNEVNSTASDRVRPSTGIESVASAVGKGCTASEEPGTCAEVSRVDIGPVETVSSQHVMQRPANEGACTTDDTTAAVRVDGSTVANGRVDAPSTPSPALNEMGSLETQSHVQRSNSDNSVSNDATHAGAASDLGAQVNNTLKTARAGASLCDASSVEPSEAEAALETASPDDNKDLPSVAPGQGVQQETGSAYASSSVGTSSAGESRHSVDAMQAPESSSSDESDQVRSSPASPTTVTSSRVGDDAQPRIGSLSNVSRGPREGDIPNYSTQQSPQKRARPTVGSARSSKQKHHRKQTVLFP